MEPNAQPGAQDDVFLSETGRHWVAGLRLLPRWPHIGGRHSLRAGASLRRPLSVFCTLPLSSWTRCA